MLPVAHGIEIKSVAQGELLLRERQPFAKSAHVDVLRRDGCDRTARFRQLRGERCLAFDFGSEDDGTSVLDHLLDCPLGATARDRAWPAPWSR